MQIIKHETPEHNLTHLRHVAVAPSNQRTGIASALVKEGERFGE